MTTKIKVIIGAVGVLALGVTAYFMFFRNKNKEGGSDEVSKITSPKTSNSATKLTKAEIDRIKKEAISFKDAPKKEDIFYKL